MNIRDLDYFIKVAEHQHFSKAAQAAFVSQPTLSMQLKKLEAELSTPLFDRTDKQVRLTETGALLLPAAKAIVEGAKHLKTLAKTFQNPFALPLHLGVIPTIGPYFLPHILPPLQKNLPALKLILIEEKTQTLLQKLQENQLDAVLLALPMEHSFAETIFMEEPFVVAMAKDHPLARKRTISLDMLAAEKVLMLEEGHCLRDHALAFCSGFDAQKETYRATSLETLCQMVALGHGITLLPQFAAQNRVQLEIRPFHAAGPSRKIGLIWKKNTPKLGLLQKVIKEMDKSLNKT